MIGASMDSGNSSLTVNEAAVLDLWDEGMAERDIIAQLQMAPGMVRYVLSTFGDTEGARLRWNRNAVIGSRLELAAIAATGRCYS